MFLPAPYLEIYPSAVSFLKWRSTVDALRDGHNPNISRFVNLQILLLTRDHSVIAMRVDNINLKNRYNSFLSN